MKRYDVLLSEDCYSRPVLDEAESPTGEYVRFQDAAARIAELEGALSGMYTLACDDAIKVPDRLYHHVTAAAAALTPPTKEAPDAQ